MLLAGIAPAALLFTGMLFLDDTPRWLVLKGRDNEAKEAFRKIQGDIDVDLEITEIKKSFDKKDNSKFKFQKWLIMPFVVGIGIMFAQICTGVNTIIYYAPTIFKLAEFDSTQTARYATSWMGIGNFHMTFVAISSNDKIGRISLLYLCLTGVIFCLLVLI